MKKLTTTMLILTALLFAACGDDEPETPSDFRDAAAGNYKGMVTYYILDGETLTDHPDGPFTIEFNVSKGTSEGTVKIDFVKVDNQSAVRTLSGTNVTQLGDGFGFDMVDFTDEGEVFSGYQGFTVDGAKYHGRFEKTSGRFTFYVKDSPGDGNTYVSRFQGDLN